MFGALIGSLVCGILADFLGRKKVIVSCFIIFTIFTFLTGFAQGPSRFCDLSFYWRFRIRWNAATSSVHYV